MKFMKAVSVVCALICLSPGSAGAASTHAVKGVVITSDGTLVPEFTVTVRPFDDKPALLPRKQFKDGEFRLDGLNGDRYRIEISAPLHITQRLEVDFRTDSKTLNHRIVILRKFRNEARLIPGTAYKVSVKALQQKIPKAAREAYLRAVELHREGKLDQALTEYGTALRNYPTYLEALGDLATIFILYNRPESALSFLRRAQDIDDCNPIINLNTAIALAEQRDYSGAIKLLKRVLKTDPGMGLAQYYIAQIRFLQQKHTEAEKSLHEAVRIQPGLLDAWLLLANLSLAQEKYEQAREALLEIQSAMNNKMVSEFIDEHLSMLPL